MRALGEPTFALALSELTEGIKKLIKGEKVKALCEIGEKPGAVVSCESMRERIL